MRIDQLRDELLRLRAAIIALVAEHRKSRSGASELVGALAKVREVLNVPSDGRHRAKQADN